MARSLVKVKWDNPAHAITAFVTIMVMPLTYSIAYGLIAGIGTWVALKAVFIPLRLIFGIPDPTAPESEDVVASEVEDKKEDFDEDAA